MTPNSSTRPLILLTGMGGVLGGGFAEWSRGGPAPDPFLARSLSGFEIHLVGRRRPDWARSIPFHLVDLEQPGALMRCVQTLQPQVVLHAAAMARQAQCEAQPDRADRVNVAAVEELCQALDPYGGHMVFCSTDQVFDGQAEFYDEKANPAPLHHYGRTKARAEGIARQAGHVVVRLPLLLGSPWGGADHSLIEATRQGQILSLFDDEWRAPARASLLWPSLARLLGIGSHLDSSTSVDGPHSGIFHLAGAEAVHRCQLGREVCSLVGLPFPHRASQLSEWQGPPRPKRLVLRCRRAQTELGFRPPDLRQSLLPLRASNDD